MTRIKVFLDQESRTVKFAKIYLVNVSAKTYGFHNGRRDFNQKKLLEYLCSEHHTGSQISPNKLFTSIILTVRKDGKIFGDRPEDWPFLFFCSPAYKFVRVPCWVILLSDFSYDNNQWNLYESLLWMVNWCFHYLRTD